MSKSKVSQALEPSKQTRLEVLERDNHKCIYNNCTRTFGLAPAHVFYARSKFGLGIKENLVMLCQHHHHIMDNGHDSKVANEILQYCKSYLHSKHEFKESDLKYKGRYANFKFGK